PPSTGPPPSPMTPSLARRLAQLATSIRYRTLPPPVRDKARLCLLDWTGCAIAGARSLGPRPSRSAGGAGLGRGPRPDLSFLLDRGPMEATVAGRGRRASALSAALHNGTAAHLLELDDVHEPSIYHPGAPVIAAALAAAQREHASGRALIESIVAGYEVSIALGSAIQPAHYAHWHTTGTMGALGAAAAASRIFSLGEAEAERALHVAATQASGLWATIGGGTPAKALHAGRAAHAGLLSALWVAEGLGSSPTLDVPRGFLDATAGRVGRLDLRRFHILDVGFKLHASCRFTHAAIDAALALREDALRLRRKRSRPSGAAFPEPRAVRVRVAGSALQLVGRAPATPEAARFSLRWCVAAAFARGRVSPEEFTPRALRDPAVRRLLRRVRTVPDASLERFYPQRWPAVVEAAGTGGIRRVRVDFARGDPRNPLAPGELVAKFSDLSREPRLARRVLESGSLEDVARLPI
ncbi:MAG: MmgE/PrpD family protein, partial [Halobacteria archaeon]